ncbi:ABC transporter substrate-binding protein [uncultured Roseovarius sp.]|uniref:ABC transporter substrate-binding protein n=1 Tax=uncultured Roseovarius sp. TaxID=293344 RepID=UPI0026133E25|nr:ABC transporter substrate-binding protein [uncultured Roseovarius sp.]
MINKFSVAAATLALTLPAIAVAKEQINIGVCVSWPGYAMHEIARQKGLADDYDINMVIFDDPLGGHAALAAGQLDVYECTGDYTPLAIARGSGVVNVAFTNPSYGVDHVILAPDVDVSDMKGQRIGAPQAYIGQLLMGVWLDSKGVSLEQVEWVNLLADEAVGPMLSGDLAAAYLYEPWITKVMENLPGSSSAVNTADPEMLKTGIFMDVVYMNGDFVAERRDAAKAMLKARFDALGWWHENTAEGNEILSEFLKWPLADVESVIGTNGKFLNGGIYMYDFNESAQVCGVMEGEPPFDIGNGAMKDVVASINDWWVRLGLMTETHDPEAGVDCSLMSDLMASGYSQSFAARE